MCLQKSKLDRHVENEACNKPKHICPMCSTEFTNNQSLTNHIIKEHPQQAAHLLPDLRCFRCSKLFSRVNLWLRLFFLFFWKFLSFAKTSRAIHLHLEDSMWKKGKGPHLSRMWKNLHTQKVHVGPLERQAPWKSANHQTT